MADFVAVIRKTIDGLPENSPETRARVYEKARATIAAKLAAIDPPPPAVVVQRQKDAIEEAIRVVEAQFAVPEPEPEDDFDDFFAEIDSHAAAEPEPESQPAASFSPPPLIASATGLDEDDDQAREDAFAQETLPPEMVPVGPAETRGHDMDPVVDAAAPVSGAPMLEPVEAARRPEPRLATSGEHALAGGPATRRPARRRSLVGPIAAVVALVAIAGASYGIWLNRGEFASLLGLDDASRTGQQTAAQQPAENRPAAPDNAAAQPNAAETASPSSTAGQNDVPEKFTQRLTPTGDEVDEGPAGTPPGVGEGTSVAAVTQPPAGNPPADGQPAQTPAPQAPANGGQPAVPVGQRAIFYEERTSAAMGTAEQGSIVWSLIQESPGNNLPPEPAIRAELVIPSKDLEMRLTIRRNADASLPASHIVEMIFLTPEGFQGGSVSNVLRLAFKPSEEAPGNPLVGIPAKIADGYFLVALSDQQADIAVNMQLMQRQSWIDIPIIYSSGRRALVTMEKGVPGDRIFNEAIQSWQSAATGSAG